jgi:hypothetical protein
VRIVTRWVWAGWRRLLRKGLLGLRRVLLLCVASCSFVLLASAGSAAARGVTSTLPSASIASSDCSEATARQVVEQHANVNIFILPNPVQQVLCGPFTGPGSNAMAVTIGAPTCWPIQNWAVFRFTAGDWQLVLNTPAYLVPPLVAVGPDIRETTGVHRTGDSRCFFNGGTRARIWHWDGARLVAGPWKQVTKGDPRPRYFYSPSHNIFCGMHDDSDYRSVFCQSWKSPQRVELDVNGTLKICQGRRCIPGVCGCREEAPTFGYGKQGTVGRFRCVSLQSGMRCTVIRSGKGFLINSTSVRRVGS